MEKTEKISPLQRKRRKTKDPRTDPGTLLFHDLFKAEKAGSMDIFEFFLQIMLFPVRFVEKFHDFKTAFIDVKMNVAPLKIGGMGFPNPCFWIS